MIFCFYPINVFALYISGYVNWSTPDHIIECSTGNGNALIRM